MAEHEDDAWLEQLRGALGPGADGEPSAPAFDPTPPDVPVGPEAEPPGLAALADAVRNLGTRLTAIESLAEDIARQTHRTGPGTDPEELERIVRRVFRSELEQVLEDQPKTAAPGPGEAFDDWVAQDDVDPGDMARLVTDLRARIARLEGLQRNTLEQLMADRRELVDEAVGQIRKLLFGD